MLKLQLFGSGGACYGEEPIAGFPSQQCHLLLCYLLLNRHHPHHRDRLAAVFWSDCSTSASRKRLRNALWRLRQALQAVGAPVDNYLAISDHGVSFLASRRYWLDTEVFETAITRYADRTGDKLTAEQAADLEAAVALYVGDLLEGIYEDWCLYDRERLRLLHLNALTKLMLFHELNGTYERGLAHGQRTLAHDPTREKVHRQMMRLFWLVGDRSAALAQYKCCAQVLNEELGISPTQQTQLLYRQMVRDRFDPRSWPSHRDACLSDRMQAEQSILAFAEHALQKLRHLQTLTQETGAELQHIEHLITKALFNAKES